MTRLLLALLLLPALAPAARADGTLSCPTLPSLLDRYVQLHVETHSIDDAVIDRAIERYVERVDPSKSLFLEAEVRDLRTRLRRFMADVKKADCTGLDAAKEMALARQKETEAWYRKALSDPKLEIDKEVSLEVDADHRAFPKTTAERDELRRKMMHFQLANYVTSGTELAEAKKLLVHRYELITRRVAEQSPTDLYASFLDAFASGLDPHTSYFSADALEDFRISMNLSLEGIGAVLSTRDGYTVVQEVVPGGAADREGTLKAKDRIIAVSQGRDGKPTDVIDVALRDVVRLIRGKKGSEVKLTVLRKEPTTRTLNVVITRDKIDLAEQAAKLRWQDFEAEGGRKLKLAILELPSFYGGRGPEARRCDEDVHKLLDEARAGKADGLVLDLSRNSGGLLQAAVDISGMFVKTGPMVAIDGSDRQPQELFDEDAAVVWSGPLVVLTSALSASASEILAGAVKDYHRGIVVGDERTFGKGTVQNVVNLPAGFGALKVTTALFFRPSGVSTQSAGVAADIVVPSGIDLDTFGEKHQPGSLATRSIGAFASDDAKGGWTPVAQPVIDALAARSAVRQAKDAEFAKVRERLEKARKSAGAIKVGDLLAEGKSAEDVEAEAEGEKKSEEPSPQAKEALTILADLVVGVGTLEATNR